MKNQPITSLSVMSDVTLITLNNIPNQISIIADIFTAIAKEDINIDMISQTVPYGRIVNISFTLSDNDLVKAINVLGKFKKDIPELTVEVNSNNNKISIYGEAMRETPGVAAQLFSILSENNIEIKLVTTSEVDISYLIYEKDVEKAINSIKKAFNL
ncbi:MAG: hypothetical protein PWP27_617 [Clostridiales bacterium]|jgi:aspartokinase|nr:hypothetical protein [Clostridiales bacterium]MDK2932807.1 hypothetical protein [Clostridiales bacterium]